MFVIMGLLKRLDDTLTWFALPQNRNASHSPTYVVQQFPHDYPEYAADINSTNNTNSCLKKLLADGYIHPIEVTHASTGMKDRELGITFEGLLFIEEKISYQSVREISQQADKMKKEYDEKIEQNQKNLNLLTAVLAIATCLLATSEGIKVYEENPCTFLLYLLIAGVLSIGMLRVIKSGRSPK